jgi:hypothetical protein
LKEQRCKRFGWTWRGRSCACKSEHAAAICATHPERFARLGTIVLQHPALAVESELSPIVREIVH